MKRLSALAALMLLAACHHTPSASTPTAPAIQTASCEKRICTREYDPVCATIEQGGRTVEQSFGNPCSVCSDSGKILKLEKGACGEVR
ncbi:alkaline protease [Neisseria sp. N95_16]|nr:alkaline protease [Neisseria sp. N95_16]